MHRQHHPLRPAPLGQVVVNDCDRARLIDRTAADLFPHTTVGPIEELHGTGAFRGINARRRIDNRTECESSDSSSSDSSSLERSITPIKRKSSQMQKSGSIRLTTRRWETRHMLGRSASRTAPRQGALCWLIPGSGLPSRRSDTRTGRSHLDRVPGVGSSTMRSPPITVRAEDGTLHVTSTYPPHAHQDQRVRYLVWRSLNFSAADLTSGLHTTTIERGV